MAVVGPYRDKVIVLNRSRWAARAAIISSLCGSVALLGGCASIPASGPTEGGVIAGLKPKENLIGLQLVDFGPDIVGEVADKERVADSKVATIASLASVGANDIIGSGDVLEIDLFEVGVGLFGGQRASADSFDTSAKGQRFEAITVDRDGRIKLPYIAPLAVAGHTVTEVQDMIDKAYHGQSQNPQALVAVRSNLSQAVFVSGDVRKTGRVELSLQKERLLDALAIAGGTVTQSQDMVVRFTRDGHTVEERLDRIVSGAPDDLMLLSGDRIELIREPQTFVSFGASNKVLQIPFDQTNLTLAEAIARVGGPSDSAANPKAVFLFRYEPGATPGAPTVPTMYRVDLMRPANYFLSQRFSMRDKDMVYISNAGINRVTKFVGIMNQLFSPAIAAKYAVGN